MQNINPELNLEAYSNFTKAILKFLGLTKIERRTLGFDLIKIEDTLPSNKMQLLL